MCGRFSLTASPQQIKDHFDLVDLDGFPERYNIAPTQPILIIASGEGQGPGSNVANRRALLVRWGFTPGWVKDPRDFPLLINARCESAIEKASFKAAMRHRRVLVPASGFYEWRPSDRQPYWISPQAGGIVAFAGVMETWSSADGSELDTGAILTVKANATLRAIHERMPVVIAPRDYERWLDCKTQEPRDVIDLMKPAPDEDFTAVPVSDLVNAVKNVGPQLQQPVELKPAPPPPPPAQMSLF